MDDARTHVGNSHFAHRPEEEEVKTDSIAREMSMHGDRPIRFFLAHLRSTCEESVGRSGRQQGESMRCHTRRRDTTTTKHACMRARVCACMGMLAGMARRNVSNTVLMHVRRGGP
jgi:hypothetical protein